MTDASESDSSVWDGDVQEYTAKRSSRKRSSSGIKTLHQSTSGWEDDVQEYTTKRSSRKRSSSGIKTPPHQSTSGWEDDVQEWTRVKTSSSIGLTLRTREETTSGWEDDVQEYGQSVSPLPKIPGQGEFLISPISETAMLGNDDQPQSPPHFPNSKPPSDQSGQLNLQESEVKEQWDEKINIWHLPTVKEVKVQKTPAIEDYFEDSELAKLVSKDFGLSSVSPQTLSEEKTVSGSLDGSLVTVEPETRKASWSLHDIHNTPTESGKKRWGSFTANYTAKSKTKGKKQRDFEFVRMEQMIKLRMGAIWAMKFSKDGKFLATGGADAIVRVWNIFGATEKSVNGGPQLEKEKLGSDSKPSKGYILDPNPHRIFTGHKRDVIDLDWSPGKNYILSSSEDKTVILWHPSKSSCIKVFNHADYVTSVRFHPLNINYYISASYDTQIRLWHIGEHRVVAYKKLETLVTTVAFSPNGKFIAAGLFDGECIFFHIDIERAELLFHSKVECRNPRHSGSKVTSVQYLRSEENSIVKKHHHGSSQCLVTTNDSRIRLFTLENYHINLKTKYKGHKNTKFMSGATFSDDGEFVICGSDDGAIYIWNKRAIVAKQGKHSKMKIYEVIKAPERNGSTTAAIFAPRPTVGCLEHWRRFYETAYFSKMPKIMHLILSADSKGIIRVFINYGTEPEEIRLRSGSVK